MSNELLRKLNLQFFADDNDNNDNSDVNDDNRTDDKTDDNKTDDKQDKTFTQAELEEIIAKRLERERKKLDKFADYDDIKKKADDYEKALEEKRLAELSEKERAEEIAKKAQEEKTTLEKQLAEYKAQIEREKITNEFIKLATSANVQYIDDAIRLADLSAVTVSEEGKVEGMEDVIKALVENKPYLVVKKQTKQIGESTNTNSDKSDKSAEQLLKEAAEKAKKSGRLEDMAAYSKLKRELGI